MSMVLHINGKAVTVEAVERTAHEVRFTLNGTRYEFSGNRLSSGAFVLVEGEQRKHGTSWLLSKGTVKLQLGAQDITVSPQLATQSNSGEAPLAPIAPMPGVIRQVLVKQGEKVAKDQPLLVMEAMKLQTTLKAGGDALVEALLVKVGDLVVDGAELIKLKAAKP